MTPRRRTTNVAASVRARLLDLAHKQGVEFQLLLSEFAIERLLFRLGASPHADRFVLKGALARAIQATFEWRGTALPGGEPLVLSPGFLSAPERQTQWRAFLRRGRLDAPDAGKLTEDLRSFLLPILEGVADDGSFEATWRPGGPWVTRGGAA